MTEDRRATSASGGRFAVATPHWAATEAACAAWTAGGNAVDAALTASAVLAVVYPHMCGLGGDLFAVVADATSQTVVNGSGAAAANVDAASLLRRQKVMPQYGPHSVTVPGAVSAWGELARRFGRRPLARAIEPAIALADSGAPVANSLARAIADEYVRIEQDPGLKQVFAPHGRALRSGDQLLQPALAMTLRAVISDGPEAFYDGQAAARFVGYLAHLGSSLSERDFREHHTEVCPPLRHRYRGHDVLVPPPNSQGFLLAEILSCIERSGAIPNHLAEDAARIAHIYVATAADRDQFLADPRRVPVPLDRLLSAMHVDAILAQSTRKSETHRDGLAASGDTVGIVVAESGGLWVSMNQSLYDSFGSGILEPSSGVICHNRGSAFSLDPSSAKTLAGGTRPPHTLLPVIVSRDGVPVLCSATMGGSAHAQIHSQILMGILDRGQAPSEAVDSPRWLVGGVKRGAGATVLAESRVAGPLITDLETSDLIVRSIGAWDERVGHAQVVSVGSDGLLSAASDRRSDGAAAVRDAQDRAEPSGTGADEYPLVD
jgi:gamma-glutamyltranspeptidase/glutathione hydrolase